MACFPLLLVHDLLRCKNKLISLFLEEGNASHGGRHARTVTAEELCVRISGDNVEKGHST